MAKESNIFQYVAKANPTGANALINNYGFESGRNTNEIAQYLSQLALREKNTFLKDLMKIHPDRPLIDESTDEFEVPRSMSNYMNGDGDGECGCHKHASRNDYGYDYYRGATYRGANAGVSNTLIDEVRQGIGKKSESKNDFGFTFNLPTVIVFALGVIIGSVYFGKKN